MIRVDSNECVSCSFNTFGGADDSFESDTGSKNRVFSVPAY